MKTQAVAIICSTISMVVTVALIGEGFVSYAPLPARELQAIFQSRIVGFGATIVVLQAVVVGALIVGCRNSQTSAARSSD